MPAYDGKETVTVSGLVSHSSKSPVQQGSYRHGASQDDRVARLLEAANVVPLRVYGVEAVELVRVETLVAAMVAQYVVNAHAQRLASRDSDDVLATTSYQQFQLTGYHDADTGHLAMHQSFGAAWHK